MKKIFCIIFILILSGCTAERNVTPKLKGISFNAQIHYYNEFYEFEVQSNSSEIVINVVEPAGLEGMKYTFKKDKVTAEYLGLRYEPSFNNVLTGGIVKNLYTVITNNCREGITAKVSKGNYEVCGMDSDVKYRFLLSPSGLPLRVDFENKNYTMEFKNVTVTDR